MKKKRSAGVTFFGCLSLTGGILLTLLGGLSIFSAPFMIILGIGLLSLKEWARKGTIILVTLVFFLRIAFMVYANCADLSLMFVLRTLNWNLLPLIWVVVYIYFFTRPKVKEQFKSKN